MLDEVIALFHQPLAGAFIANAHLPISWQVSPLRSFQESIAVLITPDNRVFVASVDVLAEALPIDLAFEELPRSSFCREFALLADRKVFSIRRGRKKKDYLFSQEIRLSRRFPTRDAYWDFLVDKR